MEYKGTFYHLTPLFTVKSVVIEPKYLSETSGYLENSDGKYWNLTDLFKTERAALEYAQEQCKKQQAVIDKKQQNLNKRKANVEKQFVCVVAHSE